MKKMKRLLILPIVVILFSSNLFSQTKVACIGNSITYGYGIENRNENSYPAQLSMFLGEKYIVENFGISARTLLKNGNLPYWNEQEYKNALDWKPDIVIIKLGTNDSKLKLNWEQHQNEFEDDYKEMIQSFKNLDSSPEIWICMIVPAYRDIWDISDSTIQFGVNPKIINIAREEMVNLIDLYHTMSGKPEMFLDDGIHPNAEGAKEMAKIIYNIIISAKPEIKIIGSELIAPDAISYQWYRDGRIIKKEDNGNKKNFKTKEKGQYHVAVKINPDDETRKISAVAEIK